MLVEGELKIMPYIERESKRGKQDEIKFELLESLMQCKVK